MSPTDSPPAPRKPSALPSVRACERLRFASLMVGLAGGVVALTGGLLIGLARAATVGTGVIHAGISLAAIALTLHWAGSVFPDRRPRVAEWIYHLCVAYVAALYVLGAASLALGSMHR